MIDPYGRTVKGIRISLTQRCNLNCVYCHHEGESKAGTEMTHGEAVRILRIASDLGAVQVKFTGGEPLLRPDLADIIRDAASIMSDVAITTNGSLLNVRAKDLAAAGLRRLNLSVPSVRPETYHDLTGGILKPVLEGINVAKSRGIEIKLNVVVLKGINDGDLDRFMRFARSTGSNLQLIELENLGLNEITFRRYHRDLSEIESTIAGRAQQFTNRGDMNSRARYLVDGLQLDIVRPLDNPDFCARCTRLRVTSDGMLKPCLMRSDNLVDLLGPLRNGASDGELKALFIKAVGLRSPYYQAALR